MNPLKLRFLVKVALDKRVRVLFNMTRKKKGLEFALDAVEGERLGKRLIQNQNWQPVMATVIVSKVTNNQGDEVQEVLNMARTTLEVMKVAGFQETGVPENQQEFDTRMAKAREAIEKGTPTPAAKDTGSGQYL